MKEMIKTKIKYTLIFIIIYSCAIKANKDRKIIINGGNILAEKFIDKYENSLEINDYLIRKYKLSKVNYYIYNAIPNNTMRDGIFFYKTMYSGLKYSRSNTTVYKYYFMVLIDENLFDLHLEKKDEREKIINNIFIKMSPNDTALYDDLQDGYTMKVAFNETDSLGNQLPWMYIPPDW